MIEAIQVEIEAIVSKLRAEPGAEGRIEFGDIVRLVTEAEARAYEDQYLLDPWLTIAELGAEFLHALHEYVRHVTDEAGIGPSFMLLTGRACSLAVSIRRLVLSGQDEAAHVVLRSILENLDIATVVLDDSMFADRFFKEGLGSGEKFWRSEISRSKVQRRAAKVIARAGVGDSDLERRRKRDWSFLSASTHSAFISAFRGSGVVSLKSLDLIPSPLGHLGINGPMILDQLAKEVLAFGGLMMRFERLPNPPRVLERQFVENSVYHPRVVGAYFLLQELLTRHRSDIEKHRARFPSK